MLLAVIVYFGIMALLLAYPVYDVWSQRRHETRIWRETLDEIRSDIAAARIIAPGEGGPRGALHSAGRRQPRPN